MRFLLTAVSCTALVGCAASARQAPVELLLPPASSSAAPVARAEIDRRVTGEWLERWQELGYHDRYRVEIDANGRIAIRCEGRSAAAPVVDAAWSGGVLTFVQRTTFDVRYRLALAADGARLEGTATTPDGAFDVVWEREYP